MMGLEDNPRDVLIFRRGGESDNSTNVLTCLVFRRFGLWTHPSDFVMIFSKLNSFEVPKFPLYESVFDCLLKAQSFQCFGQGDCLHWSPFLVFVKSLFPYLMMNSVYCDVFCIAYHSTLLIRIWASFNYCALKTVCELTTAWSLEETRKMPLCSMETREE